jgi:raffinose/stachyose/melibiose transport system permease protein
MPVPNLICEVNNIMKNNARMKKRISTVLLYIVITVFSVIMIIPFLWMLLLSFKTDTQIVNAPLAFPEIWNFENYRRALQTLDLPLMYRNTFIIVIITQFFSLLFTFMSSFAISRMHYKNKKARNWLYFYFIFGLSVPVYILLFPIYRIDIALNILDSYSGLIIPYIGLSVAFNTLLFVGFLNGVPRELDEAAIIDGCSIFTLCTKVIIPVLKPIFATVTIFNVIYIWNEFPLAVTLISNPNLFTISLSASLFKGRFSVDYSGIVAATVLIVIPQLIFYTALQKYIISGMTEGAVKG